MNESLITVEVAYALPDRQKLISLEVPQGTTALDAVRQSGIVEAFPEIDLATAKMGIFSQQLGTKGLAAADAYQMQPRDRIEIYRPLIADPKEVRRKRAAEAKSKREQE